MRLCVSASFTWPDLNRLSDPRNYWRCAYEARDLQQPRVLLDTLVWRPGVIHEARNSDPRLLQSVLQCRVLVSRLSRITMPQAATSQRINRHPRVHWKPLCS